MGYVLPINSYRSQQYANRLMNENSNYSRISQLHHVNKIGDFMEEFEEIAEQQNVEQEKQVEKSPLAASNLQNEVIGYVNPNPANISVKNANVVKKGAVINAYI